MFKVDFSILARFHNEDVRRPIPVILLEVVSITLRHEQGWNSQL
jgi:hypothetical protein